MKVSFSKMAKAVQPRLKKSSIPYLNIVNNGLLSVNERRSFLFIIEQSKETIFSHLKKRLQGSQDAVLKRRGEF